MRWRYRKLSSSFDLDSYKYVVGAAYAEGEQRAAEARAAGVPARYAGDGTGEAVAAAAAGIVSAPRKVKVEEGSGNEVEILELIAAEKLTSQDLISDDDGKTWTTLERHPVFYDEFEGEKRTARATTVVYVVLGLLVIAGAVLVMSL